MGGGGEAAPAGDRRIAVVVTAARGSLRVPPCGRIRRHRIRRRLGGPRHWGGELAHIALNVQLLLLLLVMLSGVVSLSSNSSSSSCCSSSSRWRQGRCT